MPPQKRGRNSDKKEHEDAEMADGAGVPVNGGAPSDSDDSDSDDEDDLTFTENMGDDDDDDDDDDEDDAMDGGDDAKEQDALDRHVSVDFVFSDPREVHFHSVKQFVQPYLPSSQPFNVSGLANLIVGQVAVGTMVCAEGESDVYGFITALSLQRYKTENCIQQVLQYVTKRCPSSDSARFQKILETKSVGLVVNERMVNLPYQLVPPLHSALHEDIEWAITNEETAEERKSFEFDYFLILSNCTMEKSGAVAAGGGSNNKKNGKGKKAKTEYAQIAKYFANFEDEFLESDAELSFTFETPLGERERDQVNHVSQTKKHTTVMLIERARHKAALASIAAMINM